jgi:hypothetical protein
MAITGTGVTSIRKQDLEGSKPIAIAFKKLVFAHKATSGDTGINLLALSAPTEMSSVGFVQPTSAELTSAKLLFFRKNLKLISSSRGELMDFLSYTVASNTRINFNGFTADPNEIFVGIIDHEPTTGLEVVDASPLVASGTLTAGLQDFATGEAFEVNKYPTKQVGNVIVFVDGVQQFRNTGNATASPSADGNYQEIDNGSGLGTTIRMNTIEAYDRNVVVLSNGLLVNRPSASRDQALETLAGQIDAMIPDLAAATGNPESNYQAAPNNVDLKSFGDQVHKLQRYRLVLSTDLLAERTAVGPVDLVLFNTSSGAGTLVLPTTPSAGDHVEVWDSHGMWGTFGLTIDRNGNNIEGAAADFTVNTANIRLRLVYAGSSRGWIIGDLS